MEGKCRLYNKVGGAFGQSGICKAEIMSVFPV